MASRLLTLAVWALVLASTVFWGLKVFSSRTGVPPGSQTPTVKLAMGGELRKLLGTSEKPEPGDSKKGPPPDARFQLLGVVAPRGAGHSPQGVALISVNDEPAKAWRTGAVLDGDTVLLAVNQRSVQLGPRGGPATSELSLPEPTPINAPPHTGAGPMNRTVPMMPGAIPQQPQQGMHSPAPSAQPMPRGRPPQQEDDDNDDEEE